jgi:hypothetical protein
MKKEVIKRTQSYAECTECNLCPLDHFETS